MNAKELTNVLTKTIPASLPTYTESPPACGKSEIHAQVAAALDYDFMALYPALHDPVDFSGLSFPVEVNGEKRLIRHIDDVLGSIFHAERPLLVLFDELPAAAPAVQAACAPFFQARQIGKWKIPDYVTICGAGNRRTDRAGANPILTHILSRFATLITLTVDVECWIERATQDRIATEITSFVKFRPALLYDFDAEKVYSSGRAYPNPRSWYKANQLLTAFGNTLPVDIEREVYTGCVGDGAAHQFTAHLRQVRSELNLEAIVVHGKKWKFPSAKELGLRYAFAFGVAGFAIKETLARVFEIATDLYEQKEAEYAMCIIMQTLLKDQSLGSTAEFERLAMGPLGQLIRSIKLA